MLTLGVGSRKWGGAGPGLPQVGGREQQQALGPRPAGGAAPAAEGEAAAVHHLGRPQRPRGPRPPAGLRGPGAGAGAGHAGPRARPGALQVRPAGRAGVGGPAAPRPRRRSAPLSPQCGRGPHGHLRGAAQAAAAAGGGAGGGRVQRRVRAAAAPAAHDPDPGEPGRRGGLRVRRGSRGTQRAPGRAGLPRCASGLPFLSAEGVGQAPASLGAMGQHRGGGAASSRPRPVPRLSGPRSRAGAFSPQSQYVFLHRCLLSKILEGPSARPP